MKYVNQRLAVLIDEVNIYKEARSLYNDVKLNVEALLQRFDAYLIVRTILYCVQTSNSELGGFKNKMRQFGVDIKAKNVRVFANGETKGNWDVQLALDCVQLASKVDAVCLSSHDTDFIPLIRYLQQRGIKVILMAFEESIAPDLLAAADEFVPIRLDMLFQQSNGQNARKRFQKQLSSNSKTR